MKGFISKSFLKDGAVLQGAENVNTSLFVRSNIGCVLRTIGLLRFRKPAYVDREHARPSIGTCTQCLNQDGRVETEYLFFFSQKCGVNLLICTASPYAANEIANADFFCVLLSFFFFFYSSDAFIPPRGVRFKSLCQSDRGMRRIYYTGDVD